MSSLLTSSTTISKPSHRSSGNKKKGALSAMSKSKRIAEDSCQEKHFLSLELLVII